MEHSAGNEQRFVIWTQIAGLLKNNKRANAMELKYD